MGCLSAINSKWFWCFINKTMHLKPNPEDKGVITKAFLKKLCKTDFKQYYSTP